MNPALLTALGAFMIALLHALVMEGWRAGIVSGTRAFPPRKEDEDGSPAITVIVPARDAAATLRPLLQDLYAQDHPKDRTEVIVVDDHSTDGTADIVEGMQRHWPNLRSIRLKETFGKKAAITEAAAQAFHDVIVITDADARCGHGRLSTIAAHWSRTSPDMLLMPVQTGPGKGAIGALQRVEQVALQAVAAGSAAMGAPMLANGANMAFSRSAFFQLQGYQGDRWASGDDMFLLHRMARARKRISYLLDPAVVISVDPEPTLGSAISQRLRWAGKMKAYGNVMMLGATILSLMFPWLLLFATVFVLQHVKAGQGMMNTMLLIGSAWLLWLFPIVRLVHAMDDLFRAAAAVNRMEYGRNHRLLTIPALIAFMIYAPIIAVVSIFVRPKWKGRRV